MGNNCCSAFCSSEKETAIDLGIVREMVQDVNHLDQLISIIEERLNERGQQNIPPQEMGSSSWFASCTNFGKDLVEMVSKRANKRPCKVCFKSSFNRETRKVVIDVLKEASQIHSLAAGLCVVGYVLEQIDQLSNNRDQCIQILRYICALARRVKQLDDRLPAEKEKLNEAVHFIFEGCLLCLTQMTSHRLSRLFYASVDAGDLQHLQSEIKHTYPDLILGAVIGVLDSMPRCLPPTQGEDPSAVGIEEAKYSVMRLLNMHPMDESKRAVVIYGVGGIGKTTLASAVFKSLDLKAYHFCRLDMDQNCSIDHIKQLQQQILRDLFRKRIELRSFVDGQNELAKAFREASDEAAICIFIDNALAESDLAKLLPQDLSCLPIHTRMLLTTRRLDQTNILLRSDFQRCEFSVDSLSLFDSKKLLCKIVLGSAEASFPEGIQSGDVDEIVEMCGGIPLIIELVGPKLKKCIFNKGSTVKALKESLKDTLMEGEGSEMSERIVGSVFNSLDQLCKEAFLDVVCFFNKQWRSIVSYTVGDAQLEALEDAALVKVSVDEESASILDILERPKILMDIPQEVNVHDIIVARGRKLSQMQSDRILDLESWMDAVQDRQKLQKTKGIFMQDSDACEIQAEHLDSMHASLRVLQLPESIKVNGTCLRSFGSLKYIEMTRGVLPIDIKKLKRLAVLIGTVADNVTELPASLRWVKLNNSPNIPALLQSFGNLSSLENMDLEGCDVIVTLPTSIGELKSLIYINLGGCSNLTTLPETFGNLSALQVLSLSQCSKLATLPPTFGQLKSLVWLGMEGCEAITIFPNSFGNLSALILLNMKSCSNLSSLPQSFGQLSCLKMLLMNECESLTNLPNNFGGLKSLKIFLIEGCSNLKTLNGDFRSLTSLTHLDASNCESLDGDAVDILVEMRSLMIVRIDGSERMEERWKEIGLHYPLMVIGDNEVEALLHTVVHTLFHSQSRFVGVDGGGQLVLVERSWSSFTGELSEEEEEEVEVAVLLTMCDLSLDSNIRALQRVREELEKRMEETRGSGKFHIVYAEAQAGDSLTEKSEEHIRKMLLLLPSCSCACISADDRTKQLFSIAVYELFRSGSSDAILSSHTCIVGFRVGLKRDNTCVKLRTDCFPSNYVEEGGETRRKYDLQAMADPRGGLEKILSRFNDIFSMISLTF